MHHNTLKNLSWAMVLILFINWSGIPQNAVYAQKNARLNEEERKKAVEKLEKLFEAIEDAAKEIPRDTFDPQAIVNKVGKDPIKLFEWVRDNTYLIPYRGSLRGHIGVLMDRLGNSLDRSLLLHELITIAGKKARLVKGTLTKAQAEIVLKKARPIPPEGALPLQENTHQYLEKLVTKYADKYGLDSAELLRTAQKMNVKRQYLTEELTQRVEEQSKAILEVLGKIPDIKEVEFAEALESLKDHWWVQWERGAEWVDLEPVMLDARIGDTLTEKEIDFQPDELGDDNLHLVTIRIVIERWEDGKFEKETVLEHTLRPSELLGKRVAFRHIPMTWPKGLNLLIDENPNERLRSAIMQENEWLPVLSVGLEEIWQFSFTDTGQINENPGTKPLSDAGAGIRRAFSLFGTAEEESKKESHLSSGWIEYEINIPEKRKRTIHRQIFDLVEPKYRRRGGNAPFVIRDDICLNRGHSLLGETEILFLVGHLSDAFVENLYAKSLLQNQEVVLKIISNKANVQLDDIPNVNPVISSLYNLALLRWEGSRISNEIYLNSINIMSHHNQFMKDQNKLTFITAFDVVFNEVGIIRRSEISNFLLRIMQGVHDTNAEALLMPGNQKLHNTAEVFMATRKDSKNLICIRDPQDIQLDNLNFSEDARSLIEQDLAAGFFVVVPTRANLREESIEVAWWRVDPSNGHTIGIGKRGWGTSFLQYQIITHGISLACLAGAAFGFWIKGDAGKPWIKVLVLICALGVGPLGLQAIITIPKLKAIHIIAALIAGIIFGVTSA